jgi:Arm DNA-binding domain
MGFTERSWNCPFSAYPVLTPMPKLTKRTIDATRSPTTGETFLWDSELAGFGLRIKASGSRAFILQYRNRAGRSRRLTLGRFGVLTVDQARDLARDGLAEVARGGDPAERRAADREAMTVAQLVAEYFERAEKGLLLRAKNTPKKGSTLYVDRRRAERHILPLLGDRPLKDVTTADLRAFLRDVTAGKTAPDKRTAKNRTRGGAGTASRTMGLLGAIFTYAVEQEYRSENPSRRIRRQKDKRRHIALSPEQYRALGLALEAADARAEPWQAIEAVRLIALTGCRAGSPELEAEGMRPRGLVLAARRFENRAFGSPAREARTRRPQGGAGALQRCLCVPVDPELQRPL